jgi:hypothetical protein
MTAAKVFTRGEASTIEWAVDLAAAVIVASPG